MAKRKSQNKEERIIYCSGPNWEGDGSKESSPCKFGESMMTSAERFKCSYCAIGLSPDQIYADKNGIRNKEVQPMSSSKKAQNTINNKEKISEIENIKPIETAQPTKNQSAPPLIKKKSKKRLRRRF